MRSVMLSIGIGCLLVGCSTNPVTGRNQLALVPEGQVIEASSQAYAQQMAEHRKKGEIETDPRIVSRVKGIADRIIRQSMQYRPDTRNWNWEVTVIRNPEVNAYAMAGGKVAVYSGLIEKLNPTDDELAQVLAHEIAHALSGHSREKVSVAMGTDLALAAFGPSNELARQAVGTAAQVAVQLPNSRQMESEADRVGLELAAKAGYDPRAAVSLWQKMGQLQGRGIPEFLSTHPSDRTRIENLERLVPQMMPIYQSARR